MPSFLLPNEWNPEQGVFGFAQIDFLLNDNYRGLTTGINACHVSVLPDAKLLRPQRINIATSMSDSAADRSPKAMIFSCSRLPRTVPAAIGNMEVPAPHTPAKRFAVHAEKQPYTASQKPIRDVARASLSRGHRIPITIRKRPCMIPSKCTDNPIRGTVNLGITSPTSSAKRNSKIPA